jgi:hypothetical protein
MKKIIPYLVASIGIIADMITAKIAERFVYGTGNFPVFIETHAQFFPLFALIMFFSVITFLKLILPKGKLWDMGILAFSLLSVLGAVNNVFQMLNYIMYYGL